MFYRINRIEDCICTMLFIHRKCRIHMLHLVSRIVISQ
jgi:hypothetical protein